MSSVNGGLRRDLSGLLSGLVWVGLMCLLVFLSWLAYDWLLALLGIVRVSRLCSSPACPEGGQCFIAVVWAQVLEV